MFDYLNLVFGVLLKSAHRSFLFLQESAGIGDKFTDSALYDVTRKELFAAALPGERRDKPHVFHLLYSVRLRTT